MELYIRNLPEGATDRQIEQFFKPILARLNIDVFDCQKPRSKPFARITVADPALGQKFLDLHGQTKPGRDGFKTVKQKLFHHRAPVNCSKSYHDPDEFLLKSLVRKKNEKILAERRRQPNLPKTSKQRRQRTFNCSRIAVGSLDYSGNDLVVVDHYQAQTQGTLSFCRRSLLVELLANHTHPVTQIEIPYHSIEAFLIGKSTHTYINLSLAEAPRFFCQTPPPEDDLMRQLERLGLQPRKAHQTSPLRRRTTAIDPHHQGLVASCLSYSFRVNPQDVQLILALKSLPGFPDIVPWHVGFADDHPFATQMTQLNTALSATRYQSFSFEVKFQLQRLAQNGCLPPYKVLQLMQAMKRAFAHADSLALAVALRKIYTQIPYAGPGTEASELSSNALLELLVDNYHQVLRENEYSKDLSRQYEHIASIHKATVTPAGIYLSGPEPEVKNRVLRQYSAFSNHFLQVTFSDEDGTPLRYDRTSSLEGIYHERFKRVLGGNISICGRPYEFLGFSHSSLRAQTCWFMAPFIWNGELRYARGVIRDLGDFSAIRSPAKCAARIGQAFSQAFSSVDLPKDAFTGLPEVERYDASGIHRVFSDGVGTCSQLVLEKIWAAYAQTKAWKPTICQIRYAGKSVFLFDIILLLLPLLLGSKELQKGSSRLSPGRCPMAPRMPISSILPCVIGSSTFPTLSVILLPGQLLVKLSVHTPVTIPKRERHNYQCS